MDSLTVNVVERVARQFQDVARTVGQRIAEAHVFSAAYQAAMKKGCTPGESEAVASEAMLKFRRNT